MRDRHYLYKICIISDSFLFQISGFASTNLPLLLKTTVIEEMSILNISELLSSEIEQKRPNDKQYNKLISTASRTNCMLNDCRSIAYFSGSIS